VVAVREIIIGHVAPAYVGVALWVAEHEGILERPGVGVTNVILGTTEATTEALRDRSIDIAMTAPEGTIADAVAGGPLRVIAGSANKPPLSLIALPRHRRITDLRGGRIGTSSLKEGTRHLVEAMLAAEGLHWPRDYDFALEGNHLARWRALQHGSIDAALQLVPYNYLAEEAGFSHLGDADAYVPEFAFSAVCAHRDYLAGNAEAVSALLAALLAATRWFYANVEGAATIAASRTRLPQRHALRACQELAGKQVLPADLRVSPGALAAAVGALRATGQLPPPPSGQAGQAGQAGVAEAAAVGAAALDRTCLDQAATMV
jgi:ABC-type nitrate/sulfonate/bicarbonate transport system substrate-binding protein